MPVAAEKKSSYKYILLNCIIIIFCLYIAKEVFIPLALAILLSFILLSLIDLLERYHLPKVLATWTSIVFAFLLMALVSWIIYFQAIQLAQNLPKYEANVRSKLHEFSKMNKALFSHITQATSVLKNLETYPLPNEPKQKPISVELSPAKPSMLTQIMQLSPLLNPLGTGLIVLVLLPYIVFNRQDLRERIILLIGHDDLNMATQAMDDTAFRITRYLLLNLSVNGVLGLSIGIGLYFIGLPNAFLWGFLTTFLRFIPYLGIWIAASFPLVVVFAIDPGWSLLFMVLCLYVLVEMATVYFFEPRLFGSGIGISSFALIIASIFWTWLWGIAGLFLSIPLTVCLFMSGTYVPGLEFLEMILGNNPSINPPTHLYQCLLARDKPGSLKISKNFLKNNSLLDYYDQLLIPTLSLAKTDRFQGILAEHRQQFILENTHTLIDVLEEKSKRPGAQRSLKIACLAARDEFDELVGLMLHNVLDQEGIDVIQVECVATLDEIKRFLSTHFVPLICISSLPPYALSPARHLYSKIKNTSSAKIVIGIWGAMPSVAQLESAWEGCSATGVTLKEITTQIKTCLGLDKETISRKNRLKQLQSKWCADLVKTPLNELSLKVFKKIAKAFDVPISLISIIEIDKHFWKESPDILPLPNEAQDNLSQTSVCNYVITSNETLIVPNIKKDPRFCNDAWLADRGILFFAGMPLRSDSELVTGLLCVIDTKPRKVSPQKRLMLETLGQFIMQKINHPK